MRMYLGLHPRGFNWQIRPKISGLWVNKDNLKQIVDLDDFATSIRDGESWRSRKKILSCESLRGPLHLPPCPDQFTYENHLVHFHGRGEGHHLGLDISKAEVLAAQGMNYRDILKTFF